MITKEQRDFALQPVTEDTIIHMPNMGNEREPEQDTLGHYLAHDSYSISLAEHAREFGILDDQSEDADMDAEWDKMMEKLPLFVVAESFDDPHLTVVKDGQPVMLPFKNWNRVSSDLWREVLGA